MHDTARLWPVTTIIGPTPASRRQALAEWAAQTTARLAEKKRPKP